MRPERHDWVTLRDGWPDALAAPLTPAARASVEAWDPTRRPLVVARALPGDAAELVRLGLALPGRVRIGVVVREDAIASREAPPPLEAVLPGAPAAWQGPLSRLAAQLRDDGVPARVHGSLAWQHVAADPALSYVTPESDVDLLLAPSSWALVQRVLRTLSAWDGAPPLDGELLLGGGLAVSWRELASAQDRVLVKGPAGASLVAVGALPALLERRDG